MYKPDYPLFILASILIIISMVFSYSLSAYIVLLNDYSQFHYFIRQGVAGIISIIIMYLFMFVNPDKNMKRLGLGLFLIFLFVMIIMPFLPGSIVNEVKGAKRWIKLPGFSISPVEFFKIGFIYFLAWSFHRRIMEIKEKISLVQEVILLIPYFAAFLLVVFLIAFLQKDLGQVVLLGVILIVMLIFANRSLKIFVSLGLIAIFGFVGLIFAAPHRIERIKSWWSMVQDKVLAISPDWAGDYLRVKELPVPYQVSHSLNAIFNGSFQGTGVGEGMLKLGFLSEVHTDFVLAGITEELGLLGLSGIVGLLVAIVWRIFRISRRVEDATYHLFTIGIAMMIIIAFLINSYGISGLIPIKGIAVPFLSYGGSSLLSMSIAIGMVLSISRTIKPLPIKEPVKEPTNIEKNPNEQANKKEPLRQKEHVRSREPAHPRAPKTSKFMKLRREKA